MARRKFSREFKISAVKLVNEQGYSVPQAAKSLGVDSSSLRYWISKFSGEDGVTPTGEGALKAELQRLRKENTRLLIEREILKKSGGILRQGAAVKFAFIKAHRGIWPVGVICRVLEVTRSGFYFWMRRSPSSRQQRDQRLAEKIGVLHQANRRAYGSPRIHRELVAGGEKVCRNTVARIMKQRGIRARIRRQYVPRTTDSGHPQAVARNILDRRFNAARPDRKWVADITYVPTQQSWLYLAAVMDLCSRKIVGWSMAEHMRVDLVADALKMALARRQPGGGLLHHSDRGVQYASDDYQKLLAEHGIKCSMSKKGDCYDNAAMESFFATIKTELIHEEKYATHDQARASIFEYIEVFYNRNRRHSSLGYLSPEMFEAGLR